MKIPKNVPATLLYCLIGGRRNYVIGEKPIGNDYLPFHNTSAALAKQFPDEAAASLYTVNMKNPDHRRYLTETMMVPALDRTGLSKTA